MKRTKRNPRHAVHITGAEAGTVTEHRDPNGCPQCGRRAGITPTGRRRRHNNSAGDVCIGSGVMARPVKINLDELPPIVIRDRGGAGKGVKRRDWAKPAAP